MNVNAFVAGDIFTFQVDGLTFNGTGPSKQIAKNICAEHVIQHVVTKKCNESKAKAQAVTNPNEKAPVCK